ncbi:helix-turn-helix domain-containing protein [Bifidobacterium sp.]|uniref:helix-turn-helix domain-containing protein n=1 Tax=Bifidobacterium sp. TaxID=41200 RepID=UPI0025C3E5B2|nr:helix-turn-helix transcriptional regulator [Bifidobacterium sp.]MCI1634608.1 helix-turn-helix transcriptional regulator [Bifidobacterium sp.]
MAEDSRTIESMTLNAAKAQAISGHQPVDASDSRAQARSFLLSRRGRVTPDQVGLPEGRNRRVKGLRRSEVAELAGISVEYYTKLERGALSGASEQVLDALSCALLLDDAEREYLFDLAKVGVPRARASHRQAQQAWAPSRGLQWVLDSVTVGPAFVRNGRMDLLATNMLARALYDEVFTMPGQGANLARHTFLDDRAYDFYPHWGQIADATVAMLRTEAGRNSHDEGLHDLIGELSVRSDEFRTRWADGNVRHHGSGCKSFNHSAVGEMCLAYEGMIMESDPRLTVTIYTPEPGSHSAQRMQILASWAANRYEQHESSFRVMHETIGQALD